MAKAYVFSKAASADFKEIVRYTKEQWGKEQCRTYVAQLERATDLLALGKGRFKDLSLIYPSLRMIKSESHYIFCLPRPSEKPIIIAILHERMNIIERLKGRLDKGFG